MGPRSNSIPGRAWADWKDEQQRAACPDRRRPYRAGVAGGWAESQGCGRGHAARPGGGALDRRPRRHDRAAQHPRAGPTFPHGVLDRPRPRERRRAGAPHQVRGGAEPAIQDAGKAPAHTRARHPDGPRQAGRGDIAAGILTVTPERLEKVDFGAPFFRNVAEIVVTGTPSPALASLADLSGQQVFARKSSSYWSHLEALNERLAKENRAPALLKSAPEDLQDDDLLEMLNAGLIGLTVVDRYKALTWAKVFKRIKPRDDLRVHEGGDIAWMIRKDSPKLKAQISAFAAKYGHGTQFSSSLVKKYAGGTRYVKAATSPTEMKKFERTVELFRKYGERYDMDYLLMMAQGYQESRLDQSAKSAVGAIGVMQVMPATGADMRTGDISQLEPNIHAGVKYMRFMRDQFFAGEPMDALNKTLFSFAA